MPLPYVLLLITAWLVVPYFFEDLSSTKWTLIVQVGGLLLAAFFYTTSLEPGDPNYMTGRDWIAGLLALAGFYYFATDRK